MIVMMPVRRDPTCPLTDRQLEVLCLVANGMTTREIAMELSLADATVDNHISIAIREIGAKNRLHAVLMTLYRGWLYFGPRR